MNAIPMLERCARHQQQERTLMHDDIPRGATVYRAGPEFRPSDRGVEGYIPLPPEVHE